MTIRRPILAAAVLAMSLFSAHANAWSFKEHIQFTRLAAERIIDDPAAPADMKTWLKANMPLLPSMDAERDYFLTAEVGIHPDPTKLSGLAWWVCIPDIDANDKAAKNNGAFGNPELTSHFIDLEYFNPEGPKREFQKDLSSIPPASAFPHDINFDGYKRGGYLPWSRENAYRRLVAAIRGGRLAPDPAKPEEQDHAVHWAAYLAHYSEDNTQPQHNTEDYKSAKYFVGMKSPPNVHAEVEYRMCDDPKQPLPQLRKDFWDAFAAELKTIEDPTVSDDAFASTIEVSMASYRCLPIIGEAAAASMKPETAGSKPEVDTEKFFRYVGTVDGKQESVLQMKAHQTAWAVVRAQRVLVQAWNEAHGAAPTSAPTADKN